MVNGSAGRGVSATIDEEVRVEATAVPEWFSAAVREPGLPAQVTVRGCEIRYWTRPGLAGRVLVLVHGGGAHAHWWSAVAPLLARDGQTVVALDLSGHGDSGRRGAYSLEAWAQEVLTVVHEVSPEGAVVVGHSMGGMVALTAAANDEVGVVQGVIVVDTRVQPPPVPEAAKVGQRMMDQPNKLYRDQEAALRHFRLVPRQPDPAPYMVEHVARLGLRRTDMGEWTWKFDPAVFTRHRPGHQEFAETLRRISCRTAVFHGELSSTADPGTRTFLRRSLPGSTPFVEIPQAHHHVFLDQPLAFVAAVRAILAAW
jgi:pimeloyl-ACP methyl ester carboxylesterase